MNECEHILNLLVLINFLFLFSSVGVKNYKKAFFFVFVFFSLSVLNHTQQNEWLL